MDAGAGRGWDVVVVGGGFAGSAFATVMARNGYRVIVLERQHAFHDTARGEVIWGWGVAEVMRLDLEKPLVDAGASYAARSVSYDDAIDAGQAQPPPTRLDQQIPGVAGAMCVGLPEASESLSLAAVAAGAALVRGVGAVEVDAGPAPSVRYTVDGTERVLRCRLVVGADGRRSTVRRQLRIPLHETTPLAAAAGLLVDGLHGWPADLAGAVTAAGSLHYVLPRAGGRARLYIAHDIGRRHFAGPDRAAAFIASFAASFAGVFDHDRVPDASTTFRGALPAGPCVIHPLNDSWTDLPNRPGVVLIGDAAGWNDPIIGQGLSIALRDTRIVTDLMNAGSDWSPRAFAPYADERRERMRRLRTMAGVTTALHCTSSAAGRERRLAWMSAIRNDRIMAGLQRAVHVGPENVPAESFERSTVDRVLALTGREQR